MLMTWESCHPVIPRRTEADPFWLMDNLDKNFGPHAPEGRVWVSKRVNWLHGELFIFPLALHQFSKSVAVSVS